MRERERHFNGKVGLRRSKRIKKKRKSITDTVMEEEEVGGKERTMQ